MKKALIGKKVGMTQIFDENGTVIPVTVIEAGPCTVAQVKTLENDGYEAVQLGFGEVKESKRDKMQWSTNASVGIQYDFIPQLGVYVEPGMKYYFDNGSQIENIFKDKKLNFNIQFGLRFNVGK